MTIYYMDYVNGLDANSGANWGLAKKTMDGFTAAILNPGDIIHIAKSPDPTSLGQTATWTSLSKTVTLSSSVNKNIEMCESGWVGGVGTTATHDITNFKEGVSSLKLVTDGTVTTARLLAYKTIASADFDQYNQISFWFNNAATLDAGVLQVILCTDTLGATPADTLNIPINQNSSARWTPVTINKGSALSNGIQSIAIYCTASYASKTIYFDDFIACKDPTAANSLSLTSLIAKSNSVTRPTAATSANTATNDVTVGTIAWTDINNIKADDSTNAYASITTGAITNYAKATNFGFTFDPYANIQILGIQVEIKKSASAPASIKDSSVKIVKSDGTIGVTNRANVNSWSDSVETVVYGGATDLWGETWATSNVSSANFGVVIAATNEDGSSRIAYIDHIKLTISYKSLSEGWYPIQSINDVTIKIDNSTATLGNAGRGYYSETASESVTTYKRETIKLDIVNAVNNFTLQDSGSSASALIAWEGGYNTSTDIQDGETFFDGQSCGGYGIGIVTKNFNSFNYVSMVRCNIGYYFSSVANGMVFSNINTVACPYGIYIDRTTASIFNGFINCNNGDGASGIYLQTATITFNASMNVNNNINGATSHGGFAFSDTGSGYNVATFNNVINANNNSVTGVNLYRLNSSTFNGTHILVNGCSSVGVYPRTDVNSCTFNSNIIGNNCPSVLCSIQSRNCIFNGNISSTSTSILVQLYATLVPYTTLVFNGTLTCNLYTNYLVWLSQSDTIFNGDITGTGSGTAVGIYLTNVGMATKKNIFNCNITVTGGAYGIELYSGTYYTKFNKTVTVNNATVYPVYCGYSGSESYDIFFKNLIVNGNGTYAILNSICKNFVINSGSCNGTFSSSAFYTTYGNIYASNFFITGTSTYASAMQQWTDANVYMSNCAVAPYVNKIFMYGGLIQSDSGTTHSGSGISWKMSPTSTDRTVDYPVKLSIAKIAVNANSPVTVSAWMRRDNANITGTLFLQGGQISGVADDMSASVTQINNWELITLPSFTPLSQGVVEISVLAYGGISWNVWVDDLGISQ